LAFCFDDGDDKLNEKIEMEKCDFGYIKSIIRTTKKQPETKKELLKMMVFIVKNIFGREMITKRKYKKGNSRDGSKHYTLYNWDFEKYAKYKKLYNEKQKQYTTEETTEKIAFILDPPDHKETTVNFILTTPEKAQPAKIYLNDDERDELKYIKDNKEATPEQSKKYNKYLTATKYKIINTPYIKQEKPKAKTKATPTKTKAKATPEEKQDIYNKRKEIYDKHQKILLENMKLYLWKK